MSSQNASDNPFLTVSPGRLFVFNAVPMMLIMMMSGLLTVVDAVFLGHFVGADALAAVSLVFPVLMIIIALSSLVSGGMSSLLARHLGAGRQRAATAVFAQAHGLALFVSLLLILAFGLSGGVIIRRLVGEQAEIARMAYRYLAIMILASPLQLLLGVHSDAWRNEGRAGLVALLSVGVTLANVALDYLLIVRLEMGVAGSAWATAMAQGLGLGLLLGLRAGSGNALSLARLWTARWSGGWRVLLALGAPVSLSFMGIALVSGAVVTILRLTAGGDYFQTIAAYGIVTRIFSFTFLPLMAIALATQSIVGNNFGAKLYHRSNAVLRRALVVSFGYCLLIEAILLALQGSIGHAFVSDAGVVAQVGDILRPMLSFYLFSGPILVLALYFQSIGRPGCTAALTLIKPFLLSPLLIAGLGFLFGARAIWFAFPVADGIVIILTLGIVSAGYRQRSTASGFGLSVGKETI